MTGLLLVPLGVVLAVAGCGQRDDGEVAVRQSPLFATPAFVQGNYAVPSTPQTLVTVPFNGAQTATDLNVILVGWADAVAHTISVTDSRGNSYQLAVGPTVGAGGGVAAAQSIYYAKNIVAAGAGANTVSVTFNPAADFADIRALEYSGIDPVNALDVVTAGSGVSATSNSGAVTTTNASDLLVTGNDVSTGTLGVSAGFTVRFITDPDGDLAADRVVTAIGSYGATAPVDGSSTNWAMQLAAFRAAVIGGDTTPPTAPTNLTATAVSSAQINLAWTASTDDVGVTGYLVERCQGAGCSSFAQVGTPAGTSFNDTGLTGSTSYSYRVRAKDAANNLSAYSATASATTPVPPDTQAPTAPTNLAAAAGSATQVSLTWTASTDNVGVTGYLVERCQGAGCSSFAQVGTSAGPAFSDAGLTGSTSYSYRVRATDAANNLSAYSGTASVTTPAPPDTQAPTAPANLAATATSSTQVSLTWTASTDNVGVTGYLVERCQGAGCSSFAQVATPAGTTFNDTGLTGSTSYSYRVRATDAASNLSAYSGTASATTPAPPDTQAPTAPANLTATAVSNTQINLAWDAATDNVGVTGYLVERCQGGGCSSFAQVGTSGSLTFNDTSLTGSTSYSYRVRATDAASNLGPYSATASATTQPSPDTTPPTAPTNLVAAAGSSTQISLSWTASTDDVGVTGYLVERCQGGGCSSFAQVGTAAGLTFSDSGLVGSTSYSYRVRATDAANNLSAYSGTASATTLPPPDTTPPTAPGSLVAAAGSSTQISVSWTASTDNVGVTGYLVERCQGVGCASFAQVTTTAGLSFNDTGLTASTSYSYRVRATDAASNLSAYSATASATTLPPPDTTPPTAPGSLVAAAGSSTQISVSWTASTDNVGVTGYLVERCQGVGCASFAQVTTTAGLSFNDTGLTASTSYSYRVRATDAASNLSAYSATASATTLPPPDTTPPTAPASLTATAVSQSQINLGWTASTDNIGVTNYLVERCQGAGCASFAQIGTTTGTSFSNTGLATSTSYSYRVRATDAASNLSPYSNTASATTLGGGSATPAFVQAVSSAPQTPQTTVAATLTGAQTAGNLNVVMVGWADATAHTISVTDSRGNSYALAVGPTVRAGGGTAAAQSIYYAKNIAAGANTVTVNITPAAEFVDLRVLEYSGIDPVSPVDVVVAGVGNAPTSSSGAVTTTNANDLLVAGNDVGSATAGAGAGFTLRLLTADADIAEDRVVTATGAYTATAPMDGSGNWVMQMVAFKAAAAGGGDTTPPSAPSNLAATAVSMTGIDLAWTAATDNVGVTSYLIERCQGAGCSSFAQIGTTAGTTFSSGGLSVATSYSFRVRATDAANNLGPYSGTATATTLSDTQAPTAPTNLTATVVSQSQINLAWTAATDNVGVTGYQIEHCQGAGCNSWVPVGTTVGTTFNDVGLATGTTYRYWVRATDAAGNIGPWSAIVTATTLAAPDSEPPTAPSNLTATVTVGNQVNLAWTVSTDNVAVTNYLVERCLGAGCSGFLQIGTSTGNSFFDTGLAAGSSYSYRVRATDAAANLSGYSNTATVITDSPDTVPPTAPANLTATVISGSQINLQWDASTDNVGVTGYLVERCQGVGCSVFTQIATPTSTLYNDGSVVGSTTYGYRVRARDLPNNLSPFSNTAVATTPGAANPTFVQGNYGVPQTPSTSVPVTFTGIQGAGDLNVIIVGWADATAHTISVTDTKGNSYQLAVGPTLSQGGGSASAVSMFYAKNIAGASAGGNTVTVSFNPAADFADVRILEYSGIDTVNPFDGAVGGTGNGATSSSGTLVTTNAKDLLVAGNFVSSTTISAGAGMTTRLLTNPDGDIAEDRVVTTAGGYAATANLGIPGVWAMDMTAFKAAPGAPPPPPDVTPPVVTVTSPAGGATLSGTATVNVTATDAAGVAGVMLVLDGLSLGAPDTAPPYSFTFNSAKLANGAHTLGAYAWDGAHNFGNAASVAVTFNNASPANPAQVGFFGGLAPLPIVSVNVALLGSGKVLMWDGSQFGTDARVWNPVTNEVSDVPVPANIFCSGMDQMADGKIFVAGGHPGACHTGLTAANVFDPVTNTWTVLPDMHYRRWYPTVMTLPDGRLLVMSGETTCKDCYANVHEIYDPATNVWTELTAAQFTFAFYPHLFALPDGRLMVTSNNEEPMVSQVLNFATSAWTAVGGPAVDGGSAAMYLPSKFIKVGTSVDTDNPAHATAKTAYVLDMTQGSPTWRQVASMAFARTFHLATVLPDGNVLVTGGGPTTAATDVANAQLAGEMWSPTTETWTTMSSMSAPRLYHSEAMLMPDGRVLISGGGRAADTAQPTDQLTTEYFWPPYLFKGPRPVITSAPATLQYNQSFVVQSPNAASIAKVSLMRTGSVTHSQNMSQRLLPLAFTTGGTSLTITAPVNANLAPPGNYLLFIVDTNGVPSVAAPVHF